MPFFARLRRCASGLKDGVRRQTRWRTALLAAVAALAAACAGTSETAAQPRSAIVDAHAAYPEGPLWHKGRLLVAEMGADRISAFDHAHKSVFWTRDGCGPTSLAPYGEGLAVLCHIAAR